jgi:hypothetical protein
MPTETGRACAFREPVANGKRSVQHQRVGELAHRCSFVLVVIWGVVDRGAGFALAHGVGGGGVRGVLVCISSHIRRGGEWVD